MSSLGEADWGAWDANEDGISALPLRVVSAIDWAYDEERELIRIRMDRVGEDTWYKPRVQPILEGLDAGDDLPELVRRLEAAEPEMSRAVAKRSARRLVSGLIDQGNVTIELPPVPQVFSDRFERVRELGRGGVGVVWLCRDLNRDREPVVVKHAWNWSGPFEARDQALRTEARVLEQLDHPDVVSHVAGFEVDGRFHLVRTYVEGEILSHRVLREGPPEPKERERIIRGAGDVLEHMHARGVLFLDLSPANLMIEEGSGHPVIADLSHGRLSDGGTVEIEGRWGTPHYTAPEAHGENWADPRSDVYGLGCLAAYLITGHTPRIQGSLEELVVQLDEQGATPGEQAFIHGCLQEDPAHRPPTPQTALGLLDT